MAQLHFGSLALPLHESCLETGGTPFAVYHIILHFFAEDAPATFRLSGMVFWILFDNGGVGLV